MFYQVIDGELVYKVNKSTIKKINVTLGPPIRASTLLGITDTTASDQSINQYESNREQVDHSTMQTDDSEQKPSITDWFPDADDLDSSKSFSPIKKTGSIKTEVSMKMVIFIDLVLELNIYFFRYSISLKSSREIIIIKA